MGGSNHSNAGGCPPYSFGHHPGSLLLPAADLIQLPTLPSTVLGQISHDGLYYDHYGKFSAAFDQSTMLDAPTGRAKRDFEAWYASNPDIALQIDQMINQNMLKVCGKELDRQQRGGWGKKEKTAEEKVKEEMNKEQKEMIDKKEEAKQYKKDMYDIAQMMLYDEKEWRVGVSDKADRDKMVVDVFAALNNKDFSPLYKSGLTIKLLSQYFYKRSKHSNGESAKPSDIDEAIEIKGIKEVLSQTLQQKFILINQERVIQFKNSVSKNIDEFIKSITIPTFKDFSKEYFSVVQNEVEDQFFQQLEKANMEIFEKVTEKYLDQVVQLEAQGQAMTPQLQRELIQQADKESDTLALANYESIQKPFLDGIQEQLMQHFIKGFEANQGLLNLQQSSSSGLKHIGQLQVQALQSLNQAGPQQQPYQLVNLHSEPQLNGQSFYLVNLNTLLI